MQFPSLRRYYTGVAVPVSALRTEESSGTGEFYDLIPLGEWCRQCGIEVIQLLPVQDTGFQSSPYSALSAYALHPLYVRLIELPEADDFRADIEKFTADNQDIKYLKYEPVLRGKLELLKAMYLAGKTEILENSGIQTWIAENSWVKTYAVFHTLKDRFELKSWREWPEMSDPSPEDIERFWEDQSNRETLMFHVWLQYRLDQQFSFVSRKLNDMGLLLKGDLPILMNDDSADVWIHRDFFNLEYQAGAPPDYYSSTGQNWGFPTYNWQELEKKDYSWWKARLRQASRYYHAFRIDHVLGFFRIWSIPASDFTGYLGHFEPAKFITKNDLASLGFDEGRIRWLTVPHVYGGRIREMLGDESDRAVELCFNRIGNEDLFLFKPEIRGERNIFELPLPDGAKDALADFFRDRAFVEVEKDTYFPVWTHRDSTSYKSLSDDERHRLDVLIENARRESEKIWKEHGRQLLSFMKEETTMLPCAEDLGAVPESVPVVLDELEILSLKIPRWAKDLKKPGEPLVSIEAYPFFSVCTPSVHDTSTKREWWIKEDGKREFWKTLGFRENCPDSYSPDVAEKVVRRLLDTSSCMCVFQIQELFAMESELREQNPEDSRINIPGTVSEKNWSYRITPTLEQLQKITGLSERISSWTGERRVKPVKNVHSGKISARRNTG